MSMALRPKVFVTRIIPEAGLQRIKQESEAEVWTDPLPPPYAVLKQKVAGCEGLVALLTDKIDAALLDALLREADFISVHTDLNEKTRGLFGMEQFRKMKRTAVFVNTARGPIVDQKALHDALKSGVIFAAGLDVTDPEPPTVDDPLL